MKKLHLFIFLFMALFQCLSHLSSAQYVPFPKGKAVWRNSQNFYPLYDRPPVWYYQNGQDTLINDSVYKKIYKVTVTRYLVYDTLYWFAYREDVVKQKVWIIPKNTKAEQLLFDFDLKFGDKFSGWYSEDNSVNNNTYFEVVAVTDGLPSEFDSSTNGRIRRRQFKIKTHNLPFSDNGFQQILITGIGFSSGMLTIPVMYAEENYYKELCFLDNELGHVKVCYNLNPEFQPLAIDRLKFTKSLTLYPNPTNGELNIQSVQAFKKFVIYHCTGQKVLETPAAESIDVSSLTNGLYLLEAIDSNGSRVIQKWEKQ